MRPDPRNRSAAGRARRAAGASFALLIALAAGRATAQPPPAAPVASADSSLAREETEVHLLAPGTASLPLAHPYVLPGSLQARVGGVEWLAGTDFRVATREGTWLPLRPLGPPGGGPVRVRLTYRFRPAAVPALRELRVPARPPTAAVAGAPADGTAAAGARDGAGPGPGQLTVRGSKSVRLASGNRRELVVDQNLRLNIEGRLTPEIAVRAMLSDDNLPVVPEGNTAELRDVDKVLVELEAAKWRATLGDFVAQRSGTVFGDYRRKLQGVQVTATPPAGRVEALAGAPRGIYRTLQIRGEESNQGPYRLGGGGAEGNLFIVAGSERVSLDGLALQRGADRDYVIDYVRGTITFTYRRLITAESLIVVEFEEGEGAYARTVVGAGAGAEVALPLAGGAAARLGARVTRERDDPQRLRTGELSDEDRAALAAAGDAPALAVAPGVAETAPGEGDYRRESAGGTDVFVFDPQLGSYDLSFFYAGAGQGDYGLDSLTVAGARAYSWRGAGQGSYRIGRPLPLPASQSLATLTAAVGPEADPHLAVEWNAGRVDRNVFSPRDDGDNGGVAWTARGRTGEGDLRLGGRSLGRVSLGGQHENRDSRFRPFLLRRDLFAYDRWGLGGRARRAGFLDERDVESGATGLWTAAGGRGAWRLAAQWGRLTHGAALTASRWSADAGWRLRRWEGGSLWEGAGARDGTDPLDVTRRRQRHAAAWAGPLARPSVTWEGDEWRDAAAGPAAAGGSRLRRWGGALESPAASAWRWRAAWERSLADSLRAGAWRRARDGRTWQAQFAPPPLAGVRLTGDGALRRVRTPSGQEQTTRLARVNVAADWPRLGSDWSLAWGVDNSRAEVLDRQVVFVGTRQGDYDRDGEFVGRNLGDYNVVYAGTDSLVATTEVAGDLTWRQEVAPLGGSRAWARWRTLTHLTARGRSRAGRVGPLLRFDPDALFDPEQAVLGEVTWQQDLDLLRNWRGTDLRLRWDFAQARDRQYAAHPEDRLKRGWQATFTRNLGEATTLLLRGAGLEEERRTRAGLVGSERSYEATTRRGEAEWSARPGAGNRVALGVELIRREDAVSRVSQREWALRPSARWRLSQRWSASAEVRWGEVASDEPAGVPRPYFFPFPGANRELSARAGWDPTANLTLSATWFGRQQGERGWQHDVRVESTARF